jgi:FMN phosphatase YigB (HAD superfamily)
VNVKQLLYDNVRGRVRELIWNEVKERIDAHERENNPNNHEKIKALFEITKECYDEYRELLKEMEANEKETAN